MLLPETQPSRTPLSTTMRPKCKNYKKVQNQCTYARFSVERKCKFEFPKELRKIQKPIEWWAIFLHLSIIGKRKEKCSEPFSSHTHQVRAAFIQFKLDEDVIFKIDLPKRRTRRRRSLENIQTSSTRGDQKHKKVGEEVLPFSRKNTGSSEVGLRLHCQTCRLNQNVRRTADFRPKPPLLCTVSRCDLTVSYNRFFGRANAFP